jgi:putative ABC transport system substrate-binding protein
MRLRRREFIAGLGGATAWPLAARAQQGDRVRRIGVLQSGDESDPVFKPIVSAFIQALAGLGWTESRNLRMDPHWARGDIDLTRALAQELVGLQPDIIVTIGTAGTAAVQGETRTIPIVFASVGDPVTSGIVSGLNQPGGNTTGFATNEASVGGKWLELLSEIDPVDMWRRAATYVDRILRGEKPGDLPVQLPTKFEMAVNLKTAKALGLTIPPSILLRADEQIE